MPDEQQDIATQEQLASLKEQVNFSLEQLIDMYLEVKQSHDLLSERIAKYNIGASRKI